MGRGKLNLKITVVWDVISDFTSMYYEWQIEAKKDEGQAVGWLIEKQSQLSRLVCNNILFEKWFSNFP